MAVLFLLREGVLKRWLLAGAAAALGLAVLAGGAGLLYLERPGLFVNSRTAAFLAPRLGGDWKPRWRLLDVNATKAGRHRHRYALRAFGLCAEDPAGAWSACFERLEVAALISFSRRGVRVERLETLSALGTDARADLAKLKPSGESAGSGRWRPGSVGPLRVELTRLAVKTEKAAVDGTAAAAWRPGRRRPLRAEADLRVASGGRTRRVRARLSADAEEFEEEIPGRLDASARAWVEGAGSARLRLHLRRESGRWRAAGEGAVSPSTGALRALALEDCRGEAPAGQGLPARGELSCGLRARFGGGMARAGLADATGRFEASARAEDGRFAARLAATADPVAAWFGTRAEAELTADGRLDRPLSEARLRHRIRAAAPGARFEDLVARLDGTEWAVPAPFRALKGAVSAEVVSEGDPRGARPQARYRLSTRLAGTRQRLLAHADGTVARPRRGGAVEHEGTIVIEDAALELPRLEVGPPPKFTVDARIRRRGDPPPVPRGEKPPPASWSSRLALRTAKPVLLSSNLARTPLPLTLDLVATSPPSGAAGSAGLKPFRVGLFRREATVERLDVRLSSGGAPGTLDGLVRCEERGVQVAIRLLGTTERPRVELSSEPPLKREDIIALLIFGKSPEELDPDQSASVGNTESALESRAFGLASLYLFGATPVEHVGYDSATRTTTVKLRLPGGAALSLGSDFDQSRELRLRKTLAPHWALVSEVNDQGRDSRAAATFLEWFSRY